MYTTSKVFFLIFLLYGEEANHISEQCSMLCAAQKKLPRTFRRAEAVFDEKIKNTRNQVKVEDAGSEKQGTFTGDGDGSDFYSSRLEGVSDAPELSALEPKAAAISLANSTKEERVAAGLAEKVAASPDGLKKELEERKKQNQQDMSKADDLSERKRSQTEERQSSIKAANEQREGTSTETVLFSFTGQYWYLPSSDQHTHGWFKDTAKSANPLDWNGMPAYLELVFIWTKGAAANEEKRLELRETHADGTLRFLVWTWRPDSEDTQIYANEEKGGFKVFIAQNDIPVVKMRAAKVLYVAGSYSHSDWYADVIVWTPDLIVEGKKVDTEREWALTVAAGLSKELRTTFMDSCIRSGSCLFSCEPPQKIREDNEERECFNPSFCTLTPSEHSPLLNPPSCKAVQVKRSGMAADMEDLLENPFKSQYQTSAEAEVELKLNQTAFFTIDEGPLIAAFESTISAMFDKLLVMKNAWKELEQSVLDSDPSDEINAAIAAQFKAANNFQALVGTVGDVIKGKSFWKNVLPFTYQYISALEDIFQSVLLAETNELIHQMSAEVEKADSETAPVADGNLELTTVQTNASLLDLNTTRSTALAGKAATGFVILTAMGIFGAVCILCAAAGTGLYLFGRYINSDGSHPTVARIAFGLSGVFFVCSGVAALAFAAPAMLASLAGAAGTVGSAGYVFASLASLGGGEFAVICAALVVVLGCTVGLLVVVPTAFVVGYGLGLVYAGWELVTDNFRGVGTGAQASNTSKLSVEARAKKTQKREEIMNKPYEMARRYGSNAAMTLGMTALGAAVGGVAGATNY